MKYLLFIGAVMLLGVYACNNEKTAEVAIDTFSIDSVKTQIAESNAKYGAYFTNNDSVGFMTAYTSGACMYPPNMEAICSGKGIGMFFSGGYQAGIRNIKLTTEDVTGGKDAVSETGKYEIIGADGKTMDKGKFIVIWKEEGGKWKMHRDMFNSDNPAMPAPSSK